jgi:hypothetical protein
MTAVSTTHDNDLRDILCAGVRHDRYLAERARERHRVVAVTAGEINSAGFGELFGAIQNAAVVESTLSVAKLLEPPSTRDRTRSLPAAIAWLKGKAQTQSTLQPDAGLPGFSRGDSNRRPGQAFLARPRAELSSSG